MCKILMIHTEEKSLYSTSPLQIAVKRLLGESGSRDMNYKTTIRQSGFLLEGK